MKYSKQFTQSILSLCLASITISCSDSTLNSKESKNLDPIPKAKTEESLQPIPASNSTDPATEPSSLVVSAGETNVPMSSAKPKEKYILKLDFDAISHHKKRRIFYQCNAKSEPGLKNELINLKSSSFECLASKNVEELPPASEFFYDESFLESPRNSFPFSVDLFKDKKFLYYSEYKSQDAGIVSYNLGMSKNLKLPTNDLSQCLYFHAGIDYISLGAKSNEDAASEGKKITAYMRAKGFLGNKDKDFRWVALFMVNTFPPRQIQAAKQELLKIWLNCSWQTKPAYESLNSFQANSQPALWNATVKVDEKVVAELKKVNYPTFVQELSKIHIEKDSRIEVLTDVFAVGSEDKLELIATNNADLHILSTEQKSFMRESCSQVKSTIDFKESKVEEAVGEITSKLTLCDFKDSFSEALDKIYLQK